MTASKLYFKRYRERNKEKLKEIYAKYHSKNKEKILAQRNTPESKAKKREYDKKRTESGIKLKYMKEYSRRPKVKERIKKYTKENTEKIKLTQQRRKAKPEVKARINELYMIKRQDKDWVEAQKLTTLAYRKTAEFLEKRKRMYLKKNTV